MTRHGPPAGRLHFSAVPSRAEVSQAISAQPLYGLLAGRQGTWTDLRARGSVTASLHVLGGGVEVRVRLDESGRYAVTVRRRPGGRPEVVAGGLLFPGHVGPAP